MLLILYFVFLSYSFSMHPLAKSKTEERKTANEYVHKMLGAIDSNDMQCFERMNIAFHESPYHVDDSIPDFWSCDLILLRAVQRSSYCFLNELLPWFPCNVTMIVYDAEGNEKKLSECASSESVKKLLEEKQLEAQTQEGMNQQLARFYDDIDSNEVVIRDYKRHMSSLIEKGAALPFDVHNAVVQALNDYHCMAQACVIVELGWVTPEDCECINDDLTSLFVRAIQKKKTSLIKAFIAAGVDVNQTLSAEMLKKHIMLSAKHCQYKKFRACCYAYYMLNEKEDCATQEDRRKDFIALMQELQKSSLYTEYFANDTLGEKKNNFLCYNQVLMHSYGLVAVKQNCSFQKWEESLPAFCNKWKDSNRFKQATPLMFAVLGKNIEIVKLLLAAGARIEAETTNQETIFDVARYDTEEKDVECLNLLVDHYVIYFNNVSALMMDFFTTSDLQGCPRDIVVIMLRYLNIFEQPWAAEKIEGEEKT